VLKNTIRGLEKVGYLIMPVPHAVDEFCKYWPGVIPLEPTHWMAGSMGLSLERPDYGWRVYLSILLNPPKINQNELSTWTNSSTSTGMPFTNRPLGLSARSTVKEGNLSMLISLCYNPKSAPVKWSCADGISRGIKQ